MPWYAPLILQAVQLIMPLLGALVTAIIKNLQTHDMDDDDIQTMVMEVVSGIDIDHKDWTSDQKRSYAFDAIIQWGKEEGRELKESLVNTLIEMCVQKLKSGS
jgi:hypothetical protein